LAGDRKGRTDEAEALGGNVIVGVGSGAANPELGLITYRGLPATGPRLPGAGQAIVSAGRTRE
jgi:hypothetical protein